MPFNIRFMQGQTDMYYKITTLSGFFFTSLQKQPHYRCFAQILKTVVYALIQLVWGKSCSSKARRLTRQCRMTLQHCRFTCMYRNENDLEITLHYAFVFTHFAWNLLQVNSPLAKKDQIIRQKEQNNNACFSQNVCILHLLTYLSSCWVV